MKPVAITAFKGGVGKTTVTANLGAALAERGHRVTLIDLEPSANLTLLFGYGSADVELSSVDVLRGEASISDARVRLRPRVDDGASKAQRARAEAWAERELWLVPSESNLQDVNNELIVKPRGEDALSRALRTEVEAGRDPGIVLIDCQPGGTQLTINGITAASNVLVPVLPHQQVSIDGLAQVVDLTVGLDDIGIPAQVIGVLRTHVRHKDKAYGENIAQLLDLEPLLTTEIPRTQEFENVQNDQQPFFFVRPDAPASERYRALAIEIEQRLEEVQS